MIECPMCKKINEDNVNHCIYCGSILQNDMQKINQDNTSKPIDNQQNTNQNYQQQIPQNYQQPQYNNYNSQQYNNVPQNQKSKIVGLILNMLVVGLGYAYVGKWGEGILLLVVYLIMFILGFMLLFPWIIALIIWIYSLFKTNEMIDKYNRGQPF